MSSLQQFDQFLGELQQANDGAVMIIDEAHSLPQATMEQIVEIASLESNRHKVLQFLLAGQPAVGGGATLPRLVDDRLAVRARLLPLERDECERYVHHRLTIAGGAAVTFSAPSIEVLYALSGGVPRLVNLLCERALQEAASASSNRIEPAMIDSAASALDLLADQAKAFPLVWNAVILVHPPEGGLPTGRPPSAHVVSGFSRIVKKSYTPAHARAGVCRN